jgi:hypothetical protein
MPMRTYVAAVLIGLVLLIPSMPLKACEPTTFDFDLLLSKNDKNKNQHLQKDELLAIKDLDYAYGNTLDKPINTAAAFTELDKNTDNRLSLEELWAWGVYQHNACAEWNAHAGKDKAELTLVDKFLAWLGSFF